MNVLVIAHDSSMYGASQSLLTALKGVIKKKDRRVLVLLPNKGPMEGALSTAGINYQVLGFPQCILLHKESRSIAKRIKQNYAHYLRQKSILPYIEKIASDFATDVIYTNTSIVSIGYFAARRLNINHVWHVREFGDTDYNFTYYPNRQFITRWIRKSRRSIFGSLALQKAWLGANNCNSEVVYNGVFENIAAFSARSLDQRLVRFGILGAIFPGKGQDIAIEAFARIVAKTSNCELFVYGDIIDKGYYKNLQQRIEDLGLRQKVDFKGFVNDKELMYQNLDIILNCSKSEGFGRTIVEAMVRGIPVIANRAGGIPEIINDKVNGLLYNSTADDLANAIMELVSDENQYHRLSLNGLENAKRFSVENYVTNIDRILCDAANRKNGRE